MSNVPYQGTDPIVTAMTVAAIICYAIALGLLVLLVWWLIDN